MKEKSLLEKSMLKRKPPLIRVNFRDYIFDSLALIGGTAFFLWIIAVLIAAIRATHFVG